MTTGAMFTKWCALNGREAVPAPPALVARFVTEIAPLGIDAVWPAVQEISRAHYTIGLADPTLGGPVASAVNGISRLDPPRSWPKAEKLRFYALPYDLQLYVAEHDKRREVEIRRAHNEAAAARQQLEAIQQPEGKTDGNQSTVAA